jgi:hypothetical protein
MLEIGFFLFKFSKAFKNVITLYNTIGLQILLCQKKGKIHEILTVHMLLKTENSLFGHFIIESQSIGLTAVKQIEADKF